MMTKKLASNHREDIEERERVHLYVDTMLRVVGAYLERERE